MSDFFCNYSYIHPVNATRGTLQTPGYERQDAVAPQTCVNRRVWGGMSRVRQALAPVFTNHGSQPTSAYVVAGRMRSAAAARTANLQRARRGRPISFHVRHACRTWRSIRQIPSLSDVGGVVRSTSTSDRGQSSRTRGARSHTPGTRPPVSRLTMTREGADGSPPGTKAMAVDKNGHRRFRSRDVRFWSPECHQRRFMLSGSPAKLRYAAERPDTETAITPKRPRLQVNGLLHR